MMKSKIMEKRTIKFHWNEKELDAVMFRIGIMGCLLNMRTKNRTKNNV